MGSATYFGGSHLRFRKLPLKKERTALVLQRYKVINTVLDEEIGIIHWRGGWWQYVFRAHPKIDMSRSCHKEIDKFIDKLMKQWKKKKRGKENGM